jgi:hypothetical protein
MPFIVDTLRAAFELGLTWVYITENKLKPKPVILTATQAIYLL